MILTSFDVLSHSVRLKILTSFPQQRMKLGITQILIKCIYAVPVSICLIIALNTSISKLTHSWLL